MARYNIAFTVNGTVRYISAKQVKLGNRYLQCTDDTVVEDQTTVAMLPFDSIVLDSVELSPAEMASTENADPEQFMAAIEARQSDDA